MRIYNPTIKEIDALFEVNENLNDSINLNNDYFYDEETTDEERKIIFNSVKQIYKSCLKISQSNKLLPFC